MNSPHVGENVPQCWWAEGKKWAGSTLVLLLTFHWQHSGLIESKNESTSGHSGSIPNGSSTEEVSILLCIFPEQTPRVEHLRTFGLFIYSFFRKKTPGGISNACVCLTWLDKGQLACLLASTWNCCQGCQFHIEYYYHHLRNSSNFHQSHFVATFLMQIDNNVALIIGFAALIERKPGLTSWLVVWV